MPNMHRRFHYSVVTVNNIWLSHLLKRNRLSGKYMKGMLVSKCHNDVSNVRLADFAQLQDIIFSLPSLFEVVH